MNSYVEGIVADRRVLTESELFRSYWDDGLLDLISGLALLVTGLGWTSQLGALAVVQAPLWVVLWSPLRQRIVEPHAGFVRFSLSRRRRTDRRLWQTLALGVAAFALAALLAVTLRAGGLEATLDRAIAGLPAVLVGVAAVLAGLLTGARRFYAYAVVLFVTGLVTVVLARGPALPLIAAGVIVVTWGAVMLARFLRASRAYEEAL